MYKHEFQKFSLITLHKVFWTLKNADFADSKRKICVFSVNQRPDLKSVR